MTDSARTEEIRARVAFYPPGSNCNYCYGSEHYAEDVPYLLTELTALREEVERLRAERDRAYEGLNHIEAMCAPNPQGRHRRLDKIFGDINDTVTGVIYYKERAAALSPSPAQQEEHNES